MNLDYFMIRGYQPPAETIPEGNGRFQWGPAFLSGFIAGLVLLFVPRANPWSAQTFFSPVFMGRTLPVAYPLAWVLHLGLSLVYGLIIARVVARLGQPKAMIVGALMGVLLYFANLGIISAFFPELRSNELTVFVVHLAFGLIATGAYRGLLKRKVVAAG